jgi:tRNA threonylcarbamoyladenosine biosynthesis protein TsaB
VIVLGFDTSTPSTAVAVRFADGRATQMRDDPAAGAHPGHATRLLAMAHELLAAAGASWSEIDRVAVGLGPGTFTGLRVGIATARGLAQSLPAELVGISSLQALALPALAAASPEVADGGTYTVLAVTDARRGEVFAAAYQPGDELPTEVLPPQVLAPQALGAALAGAAPSGDEGERRWTAVGDGAVRFRADLEGAGVSVPPDASALHGVSAEVICELATRADPTAALEQLLPDYRRRPDAELTLEAAGAGGAPGG